LESVETASLPAPFSAASSSGMVVSWFARDRRGSVFRDRRRSHKMVGARMLAYITGTVDQELLLRNEYLAGENRIF
jgi:hypothetical protein